MATKRLADHRKITPMKHNPDTYPKAVQHLIPNYPLNTCKHCKKLIRIGTYTTKGKLRLRSHVEYAQQKYCTRECYDTAFGRTPRKTRITAPNNLLRTNKHGITEIDRPQPIPPAKQKRVATTIPQHIRTALKAALQHHPDFLQEFEETHRQKLKYRN